EEVFVLPAIAEFLTERHGFAVENGTPKQHVACAALVPVHFATSWVLRPFTESSADYPGGERLLEMGTDGSEDTNNAKPHARVQHVSQPSRCRELIVIDERDEVPASERDRTIPR